jgi:rhomboid protease GluP
MWSAQRLEHRSRNIMSASSIEVFRSASSADCKERAFVLMAVGIPSTIDFDGSHFLLQVEVAASAAALGHLAHYESERRPVAAALPPLRVHPNAWVGCVLYAMVLTGVAFLISNGFLRLDAFEVGELDAGRVQGGQWWRAWTALTLHLGGTHLAANLVAGVWFGYLAGRQIGSGNAWLLIVWGAGFANLLEALLGPSAHRAVGASTAVFTALGLLAAHSWRTRLRLAQRWASQWGPLVGGVALLAWTGSGGEGTDVVAHLAGFLVGTVLGAIAAEQSVNAAMSRIPQWVAGLLALGSIATAWACALAS